MNEKAKRHTTTITAELQERLNQLVPGEPRLNGQIKKMARELELRRMNELKKSTRKRK